MLDCELHFRVESGPKIVISDYATWESRGEGAVELLADLVENWPELFTGRSGAICFRDRPPNANWGADLDLAFCTTLEAGKPTPFLPFPCPYFLRWPQVGIPNAEELMAQLLADESPFKDERILWIGADTHPSRRALSDLARRKPERFDVEIMRWVRDSSGNQRSATRQISIPDHRNYKYLIDCPGNGYSARIKWLLATGRPLFIVAREIVEPWHEALEPWVHYVPVAADLTDLLEHHAKLEADVELYEAISRNARKFAADNLTVEARLTHTAEAVWHASRNEQSAKSSTLADPDPRCRPLKVVTVHSDNMLPLYENFVASLEASDNCIQLCSCKFDVSSFPDFGFRSNSWYRMISHQIEHALQTMTNDITSGEYFIVSDVDIHFFRPAALWGLVKELEADNVEFAALLDREDYYNSGFLVLKRCRKVLDLFTRTLELLKRRRLPFADQDEINRLLPVLGIKHRAISPQVGVLGKQPVYEETVFYHATFADDLPKKLQRISAAKLQMQTRQYGVWQDF